MKNKAKQFFIPFILLLFGCLLNSCKEKGCTDPNAINFNSVADEDDGTCITCVGETDTLGTVFATLYDNNFSSPHYNQHVATFYVTQVKNKFTYTECGTNNCAFQVKIESRVNSKMIFTFNMQTNGNIFFQYIKNVTVLANEVLIADNVPPNIISNPCGFISNTSLFVSANGNIIYN